MQSESRICQNCKSEFVIEPDDFAFYERMRVPPPGLCPNCRFVRRALFRNERTLYSRTCDLCGKSVISMYNPKSPYTIFCKECYLSDKWDPREYGVEYDTSRPFFEQFKELLIRTPKSMVFIGETSVNSEYTNVAGSNKDCYLLFNASHNENVMYSRGLNESRDTLDGYFGYQIENCYEIINVHSSNGVLHGQNSVGDIDSCFLLNTSGCQNCFGCVNVRHGTHQYFNQKLSDEEYEAKVSALRGSFKLMEQARQDFEMHILKFPQRESTNVKTVASSGNYLFECKNIQSGFECQRCENCKYCFSIRDTKDSYDLLGRGLDTELMLEGVAAGSGSQRIVGCYAVGHSSDVQYSFDLRSCMDCFGCDSLQNAKFCILNKQYKEGEYRKIRESIIRELTGASEYGLFFPPTLALFAYNETIAQENFPLTKDEAINRGYGWEDNIQKTTGKETMKPEDIPDHIKDVPDSIVGEILSCVSCARNYKIVPAELQFYRKETISIPRKCFDCRHMDRVRKRGPIKLFSRQCDRCKKEIKTTFALDRPEIVYCEQCYQAEVV